MDTDSEFGARTPIQLPFALTEVFEKLSLSAREVNRLAFVLLVGSFAEGLQSPTSDVDLVLVGKHPTSVAGPGEFTQCMVDGKRFEIWNLSFAQFEKQVTVARLDAFRGHSIRQLELTHKLLKAICLRGHDDYLKAVSGLQDAFSLRMSDYFSQSGEGVFKDILGALQVHDYATAAVQASELVGFAVDAFLASQGDTYPKRKWRARRLLAMQSRLPILASEYGEVAFGGPHALNEEQVRAWIARCLALVRGFQLRQYFEPDSDRLHTCSESLFYLYRTADRFVVRTASAVLQVPFSAAFELLSGRDCGCPESVLAVLRAHRLISCS